MVNPTTGDTIVTVACFAQGTRIATPHGEAAVETLRPGDMVSLASGERGASSSGSAIAASIAAPIPRRTASGRCVSAAMPSAPECQAVTCFFHPTTRCSPRTF